MADYCVSSILQTYSTQLHPRVYVRTYVYMCVYSAADAAKFTTYTVIQKWIVLRETRNLPFGQKNLRISIERYDSLFALA